MAQISTPEDLIRFYQAFSDSDFNYMLERLHPDCLLGFPGSSFGGNTRGSEAIIEKFRGIQHAMGGTLKFDCQHAWLQDQYGGVQWFTSGQPAHGGRYENRGVVLFRFKDGLIIDFQDYLDTEILAAFWPEGQPASDLSLAEALVKKQSVLK